MWGKSMNWLEEIESRIIAILLILITIITFAQVLSRYVWVTPFPWSEELSRYLMIWLTFIGGSVAVSKKNHLGIEVLDLVLKGKALEFFGLIVHFIGFIFNLIMTIVTFSFVMMQVKTGQLTPAMQVPMYLANAAILAGCFLMSFHYLFHIVTYFSGLFVSDQEGGAGHCE